MEAGEGGKGQENAEKVGICINEMEKVARGMQEVEKVGMYGMYGMYGKTAVTGLYGRIQQEQGCLKGV